MKTIKAFLAKLFESKWDYYDNCTVRVHKQTGEVQYWNMDDWGGTWLDTPLFSDTPLWHPSK